MTKASSTIKPVKSKTNKLTQPTKLEIPTKAKQPIPRKKASPTSDVPSSKQDRLIAMMKQTKGSAMPEMMEATGWQAHSIRGLISGVLKKRLNLNVVLESSSGGARRYRIIKSAQA